MAGAEDQSRFLSLSGLMQQGFELTGVLGSPGYAFTYPSKNEIKEFKEVFLTSTRFQNFNFRGLTLDDSLAEAFEDVMIRRMYLINVEITADWLNLMSTNESLSEFYTEEGGLIEIKLRNMSDQALRRLLPWVSENYGETLRFVEEGSYSSYLIPRCLIRCKLLVYFIWDYTSNMTETSSRFILKLVKSLLQCKTLKSGRISVYVRLVGILPLLKEAAKSEDFMPTLWLQGCGTPKDYFASFQCFPYLYKLTHLIANGPRVSGPEWKTFLAMRAKGLTSPTPNVSGALFVEAMKQDIEGADCITFTH